MTSTILQSNVASFAYRDRVRLNTNVQTMRAFAAVAVFAMLAGVVSAHHSRAGYDNART